MHWQFLDAVRLCGVSSLSNWAGAAVRRTDRDLELQKAFVAIVKKLGLDQSGFSNEDQLGRARAYLRPLSATLAGQLGEGRRLGGPSDYELRNIQAPSR
jgi:hypothetical protein